MVTHFPLPTYIVRVTDLRGNLIQRCPIFSNHLYLTYVSFFPAIVFAFSSEEKFVSFKFYLGMCLQVNVLGSGKGY